MIPHSRPWLVQADVDRMNAIAASDQIANGPQVALFERRMSGLVGHSSGFATASGTAALELALRGLNVTASDEVVLPTYVCNSVLSAVRAVRATPVFCDVGTDWAVDPNDLTRRITTKTRVVIIAHMFGIAAEVGESVRRGTEYSLIEDCAQAVGASCEGRLAGSVADVSCFSFHATKCLTTGEGGMMTTRMAAVADRIAQLRQQGQLFRASMSDLQGALGNAQLDRYDEMLRRRGAIAHSYFSELAGVNAQLPHEIRGRSMFFRFPLRIQNMQFDRIRAEFGKHGVVVRRGVDELLHRGWGQPDDEYPGAARAFAETLSLPMYPALSEQQVDNIVRTTRAVLGS